MSSEKEESKYGEPMPWIGSYVAVASAVCMVAMAADVIRSLRGSKFWIPSKFFAFNAAMLTVLGIATKIPSDINGRMPGEFDQLSKLSGILLICVAMSHAMPSLGVMGGYVLLSNMIALGILVFSTAVDIWFQVHTKVIDSLWGFLDLCYTVIMMFMYAILVSHVMSVSTVKLLLEKQFDSKHNEIIGQVNHHINSDGSYDMAVTLSIERLKEYVKKYWLMTLTSSPDYVLRTSGVSFACSLSCCFLLAYLLWVCIFFTVLGFKLGLQGYMESDYKWSTGIVLLVQILASVAGTLSSVLRMIQSRVGRDECGNFRSLLSIEQYRAQQHESWRKKPLPFHIRNKRFRSIAYHAKAATVALLIIFQRMVIFYTRLLHLIFFCIGAIFNWPRYLFRRFITRVTKISPVSMSNEEDLSDYVLTLEGESDPKETARKWKDYPNRWIKEGQAGRPRNLYALLTRLQPSSSFVGFHSNTATVMEWMEDCWSLSIATLVCIIYAAYHGTYEGESLELLMEALDEAFPYIIFVDENHAHARKEALETAKMVWQTLRIRGEWLDRPLRRLSQQKNIVDTIEYLEVNARNRTPRDEEMDPRDWSQDVMAAKSMARITKYVLDCQMLLSFKSLEAEVAATVRRCLENMPIAILNECSRGSYGSREEHVRLAARMLGEMEEILKLLEERRMDP